MQIIEKLFNGRTISDVLGKNSSEDKHAVFVRAGSTIADIDETSCTPVAETRLKSAISWDCCACTRSDKYFKNLFVLLLGSKEPKITG